jgi:RimJ/RimL family protein N-acetyltransferase
MDLYAENGSVTPIITTDRLVLRPVTMADADDIVELINDWDVAKWLAVVPFPYTPDDADDFITHIAPGPHPVWAIDNGSLIGVISIGSELGYWLGQAHWGRGYMSEAARAVVARHFADPAVSDLVSGHFVANERSAAVLAGLGFENRGLRRIFCLPRGEDVDSQSMILTREAWQARHG